MNAYEETPSDNKTSLSEALQLPSKAVLLWPSPLSTAVFPSSLYPILVHCLVVRGMEWRKDVATTEIEGRNYVEKLPLNYSNIR